MRTMIVMGVLSGLGAALSAAELGGRSWRQVSGNGVTVQRIWKTQRITGGGFEVTPDAGHVLMVIDAVADGTVPVSVSLEQLQAIGPASKVTPVGVAPFSMTQFRPFSGFRSGSTTTTDAQNREVRIGRESSERPIQITMSPGARISVVYIVPETGSPLTVALPGAGRIQLVARPTDSAGQSGGTGVVLPPGVKRITFGKAITTKNARGGLECSIPQPLPEPVVFSGGVTTISYVIEVDPQVVPALTATIVGAFGSGEVRGEGCDRVAVCAGQLCQPQYGRTYSNTNGAPIKGGTFVLEVQMGNNTLKVPFSVK